MDKGEKSLFDEGETDLVLKVDEDAIDGREDGVKGLASAEKRKDEPRGRAGEGAEVEGEVEAIVELPIAAMAAAVPVALGVDSPSIVNPVCVL